MVFVTVRGGIKNQKLFFSSEKLRKGGGGVSPNLIVAQQDDLCIGHWLFVLIISVSISTERHGTRAHEQRFSQLERKYVHQILLTMDHLHIESFILEDYVKFTSIRMECYQYKSKAFSPPYDQARRTSS